MKLREAGMQDISQIKEMYKDIVSEMEKNDIYIWDEIYPCEFLEEDIKKKQFYILVNDKGEMLSGFALNSLHEGEKSIIWEKENADVRYIDRLGVHVKHLRKGIGLLTLKEAISLTKRLGGEYLRLFVVDNNFPAIMLYEKAGFKKREGIYEEKIDSDLSFKEYGYEVKTI